MLSAPKTIHDPPRRLLLRLPSVRLAVGLATAFGLAAAAGCSGIPGGGATPSTTSETTEVSSAAGYAAGTFQEAQGTVTTPPSSTTTPSTTTTATTATKAPSTTSTTRKPSPTSSAKVTSAIKPTARPSASPTTKKATAPAATLAPVSGKAVSGCGNPNPGKVLLTFDDGGPKAAAILAVLDRYGIKARWFPTGQWASGNQPFISRLIADGQMLGNHSYSHPQMLASLGTAELNRQVSLGYHPTKVFRFPYGASDATSRSIVSAAGYSICGWSIDTLDWRGNSTDTIYNIVTGQARPGAVVLMHMSFQTDVDALPRIIANLRGRGLI